MLRARCGFASGRLFGRTSGRLAASGGTTVWDPAPEQRSQRSASGGRTVAVGLPAVILLPPRSQQSPLPAVIGTPHTHTQSYTDTSANRKSPTRWQDYGFRIDNKCHPRRLIRTRAPVLRGRERPPQAASNGELLFPPSTSASARRPDSLTERLSMRTQWQVQRSGCAVRCGLWRAWAASAG